MKKFIALVIVALCFCACDDCDGCDDCDRGHYIACKELGDLYYQGEGVAQDFDKALNYHNKACELNTGSCFGIAYFYEKEKKYNVAISFFEKGCDKNHIDSCSSLGWLYYYTQDFDKALNYHNKACELNTSSCISVGEFYEKEKKYNIAVSVYEKACDKNDTLGCIGLGNLYYEGKGVTQDFDKALNYHNKACELNTGFCISVGEFYEKEKKYNIAISVYEKACDKNHIDGCKKAGVLYYEGKGVTKDFEKALSYYEKACDKNDGSSCKLLGGLYYKGKGVTQDFEKALSYHKKACELDTSYYCGWVGDLYLKDKKYNEAKYFMEKSCKSDCYNEGWESAKNKDYIEARLYYEITCDKGSAAGCNNLGVLYGKGRGVAKNTAKAKTFYEKSCGMNEALACQNVGYHYYNARQFAKAKAAFEQGCGANLADSCSFLGVLYEFGEGVRQDLSTAKSYYGKGCDGGSQRGCDGYKKLNQRGVK